MWEYSHPEAITVGQNQRPYEIVGDICQICLRLMSVKRSVVEIWDWPHRKITVGQTINWVFRHCTAGHAEVTPLFDEQQFRDWLSVHMTACAIETGHFCPSCYCKEKIFMATTRRNTTRSMPFMQKVWLRNSSQQEKLRIPSPLKPFNCSCPFKEPAQYKSSMF